MMNRTMFGVLTLALALALGSAYADAATKAAPKAPAKAAAKVEATNADCLDGCHGEADAKAENGKSVAIDGTRFDKSVHGTENTLCTDCHADVKADEDHVKVKPVDCSDCHDKEVEQYQATVHGQAAAGKGKPRKEGDKDPATCKSCHGSPHYLVKTKDPASPTNHANLEKTCGTCHETNAGLFHDSLHGQVMAGTSSVKADAKDAPTCTNCHGAHDIRAKSDPKSKVARVNVPATCGTCHKEVKAVWEKSQHGKMRASNVMQAPGCSDCHAAHEVKQHEDPKFKLAVTDRCATCHADFAKSYRDTFHGQVTQLGFTQIATCANCHGAHAVLPASDPASKVSPQNRLATCQKCHPKANANFVSFDPHANKHDRKSGQILFFTGKFMELLLFGVFSFFGVHTVLWFLRSLKAMREKRANPAGSSEKH